MRASRLGESDQIAVGDRFRRRLERKRRQSAASASFAYVSDDGCVENEVIVFANQTTAVADQAGTAAKVMYSRSRYDYCEDSDLGTDVGTSLRPAFSGDLNRAALNATINGTTASGSPVTVSFALVWEGKGGITHQAGRPPNTRSGSTKAIGIENLSRNAVVSGTMDGQNISDATVSASLHTTRKTASK
ncbi:MAG: hypothetical protein ACLQU1_38705 [Bryobacteraceae bacterium]